MNLVFVRHGESEDNVQGLVAGCRRDPNLTRKGVEQSQIVAHRLQQYPLTLICTSPLRRTEQTANIINDYFHLPIEIRDELCEYDPGILTGLSLQNPHFIEARNDFYFNNKPFPEGESFQQVLDRGNRFLEQIYHEHQSEYPVVVSHKRFIQILLGFHARLSRQQIFETVIENSGICTCELEIVKEWIQVDRIEFNI